MQIKTIVGKENHKNLLLLAFHGFLIQNFTQYPVRYLRILMPFYILSKNAVLETFDDGSLVPILPERRLVEPNPSAVDIINLLDVLRRSSKYESLFSRPKSFIFGLPSPIFGH